MKLRGNIANIAYETSCSAAFDIRSIEDVYLKPGERTLISTGLYIESCEDDECLLILPKSGLAFKKGISILNTPGLIDADYPGEIMVLVVNFGNEPYSFSKGDAIAQGFLQKVYHVDEIPVRERTRQGGFGSTGK